jgi:hypothetical protein
VLKARESGEGMTSSAAPPRARAGRKKSLVFMDVCSSYFFFAR